MCLILVNKHHNKQLYKREKNCYETEIQAGYGAGGYGAGGERAVSTGEGEVCYALADSQASIQSLYTSTGSDRSVEGEDRHSNTIAAN